MSKVIGTLAYSKPILNASFWWLFDNDNEEANDVIMYLLKSWFSIYFKCQKIKISFVFLSF